jgi:arylsulfatase A-like enzyme
MTDKPNFLFFFPDQHRGDWMPYSKDVFKKMGMDELPLRMPNLKRLMNKGVTFTN